MLTTSDVHPVEPQLFFQWPVISQLPILTLKNDVIRCTKYNGPSNSSLDMKLLFFCLLQPHICSVSHLLTEQMSHWARKQLHKWHWLRTASHIIFLAQISLSDLFTWTSVLSCTITCWLTFKVHCWHYTLARKAPANVALVLLDAAVVLPFQH